jgi:hypothetical protein
MSLQHCLLCKKNILLCNEQHPLPLFSLYVMDPPSLLVLSKLGQEFIYDGCVK